MNETSNKNEHEFLEKVISDLSAEISDGETIQRGFLINQGIRSDAVIVDSEGNPKVVIEVKTQTESQYREQGIQQLKTYIQASSVKYGLYISPDVQYLFSLHGENENLELTHSNLSDIGDDIASRRAFTSYEELAFCYDRARKQTERFASSEATIGTSRTA